MNVASLREWIKTTREREGVNWYLRDTTPSHEFNKLFDLIIYDNNGTIVQKIKHIEPRRNNIPEKFILQIAEARHMAGINAAFVRLTEKKGGNAELRFSEHRQRWEDAGRDEFIRSAAA